MQHELWKEWSQQACGGPYPGKSLAEIDALMCAPRVIMYLDHIDGMGAAGSDEQTAYEKGLWKVCGTVDMKNPQPTQEKKARKPKLVYCPHCGKRIDGNGSKVKWGY